MTVNATAVWRVRPSGSNTNGGGYDADISGAGTDYSQQNAAQASGSAGTASGTTTFADATALAFTAAMVGNAIWIASGSGFTAGAYFVVGYTSSSVVTLDRSPGTGSAAVWKLGGGWADFWTNTSGSAYIVGGNTVYILGSGVPNPASYTYDYTMSAGFSIPSVSGFVTFAADPSTPGGGKPCIKNPNQSIGYGVNSGYKLENLWIVASANGGPFLWVIIGSFVINCVFDGFGYDVYWFANSNSSMLFLGCEVFSSVAKRSTNSNTVFENWSGATIQGCNFHDCIGTVLQMQYQSGVVSGNLFVKNGGDAIYCTGAYGTGAMIVNNTIDGNAGNGINFPSSPNLTAATIMNNILSNHTGVGKSGVNVGYSTPTLNKLSVGFFDYNTYYNNTADITGLAYGPHDTYGGANPYVAESSENYTLTSTYYGVAYPQAPFPFD